MAKEEVGTSILDWPGKLTLNEWGATIPEKIRGIKMGNGGWFTLFPQSDEWRINAEENKMKGIIFKFRRLCQLANQKGAILSGVAGMKINNLNIGRINEQIFKMGWLSQIFS